MNRALIVLLCSLALLACNQQAGSSPAPGSGPEAPEQPAPAPMGAVESDGTHALQFKNYMWYDSADYLVFPLLMARPADRRSDTRLYSSGEKDYSDEIWNLVFYNRRTQAQRVLAWDQKMVIKSFGPYGVYHDGTRETYKHPVQKLYYRIITDDYNRDGKLDELDPTYLYQSNPDGTEFERLSPANADVLAYQLLDDSTMLITAAEDSNRDGRIDHLDAVVPFRLQLNTGTGPMPVFAKTLQTELLAQYKTHWPAASSNQ